MPWIAIEGGLLDFLGLIPSAPVSGYRIPALVREAGGHPLLQGGAAANEIFMGRFDLATARILFGERYEAKWAPIVLLPVVFCLVSMILLLRFPQFTALRKPLTASAVLLFGGCAAAALRLSGEATASSLLTPSLVVHDGVWMTVLGAGLTATGAALTLRRRSPRRR